MDVIPARVREARTERGLSLADLAGTEVSRAFIHQIEQGLARPSIEVLEMIATRTGKPMSFFVSGSEPPPSYASDLPSEMVSMSKRLERMAATTDMSEVNHEALRLVINSLRHGARLVSLVTRDQAQPDSQA